MIYERPSQPTRQFFIELFKIWPTLTGLLSNLLIYRILLQSNSAHSSSEKDRGLLPVFIPQTTRRLWRGDAFFWVENKRQDKEQALFLVYNKNSLIYNCIVADVLKSYSNVPLHTEIGNIIRAHSTNTKDIRSIANEMIKWKNVKRIIDLGCGYGWYEDSLEGNLGLVVGVDCLPENAPLFISRAKRIGEKVIFKTHKLPYRIDFEDGYFDVVICAYSLYFFTDMLQEIKRILSNTGTFIAITHSEKMLEEGKRFFDFKNLRTIIENFSAENGESLLKKYFSKITTVEYNNSLLFRKGDEEKLSLYIDFKREFISEDADPSLVRETMLAELNRHGELSLNKNDKIFTATK